MNPWMDKELRKQVSPLLEAIVNNALTISEALNDWPVKANTDPCSEYVFNLLCYFEKALTSSSDSATITPQQVFDTLTQVHTLFKLGEPLPRELMDAYPQVQRQSYAGTRVVGRTKKPLDFLMTKLKPGFHTKTTPATSQEQD